MVFLWFWWLVKKFGFGRNLFVGNVRFGWWRHANVGLNQRGVLVLAQLQLIRIIGASVQESWSNNREKILPVGPVDKVANLLDKYHWVGNNYWIIFSSFFQSNKKIKYQICTFPEISKACIFTLLALQKNSQNWLLRQRVYSLHGSLQSKRGRPTKKKKFSVTRSTGFREIVLTQNLNNITYSLYTKFHSCLFRLRLIQTLFEIFDFYLLVYLFVIGAKWQTIINNRIKFVSQFSSLK